MAAVGLLRENPTPTEREVREGLEGNLCRCTGYHNIVRAVLAASGQDAGGARARHRATRRPTRRSPLPASPPAPGAGA